MGHNIAVIGGDGIGPEVVAEALAVVRAAGVDLDTVDYDLGAQRYLRTGEILPDDVLDQMRNVDAILLGAVGSPEVAPGILERGLLLRLRFELDLYVNLRPFKTANIGAANIGAANIGAANIGAANIGAANIGAANIGADGIDAIVVRENTEGVYAGEGGVLRKGTPFEIATQGSVNTRRGVERCVRFAFAQAEARPRRHLTLVHKTNVLAFAGDLWQRTFDEVAAEHPGVTTAYCHVDAACIYLVESPRRFDVIVTDNLFGDILTDLAGAVSGGIGAAASANLNPDRTGPSLFEPVHGSAPDIAGTGKANPLAAIRSAAMMLDFLGEADAARRVFDACTATIADGRVAGGTTTAISNAVQSHLSGTHLSGKG